jgi:glutathione S-transferase
VIVYGAKISYFTGKFEAYLRYREIPYEYRPLDARLYRSVVPERLGATQYPTVELDDGRWMSDTTPMIAWLEEHRHGPAVIPGDPVQRYLSLLVEDYADE